MSRRYRPKASWLRRVRPMADPDAGSEGVADEGGSESRLWREKALELLKAEYESIRAESAQARQAQQSIIQWSLATLGVALSVGILVVNAMSSTQIRGEQERFLYVVFVVLFGVAFPAAAWLSCLAWFGELIRMERAGRYLRGLEVAIKGAIAETYPRCDEKSYLCAPLRWESYIAYRRVRSRVGISKQRIGYLGNLGLYTGLVLVPLVILTARFWVSPAQWTFPVFRFGVTAYACLVLGAFIVSAVRLVLALQATGSEVPDVSEVTPSLPQRGSAAGEPTGKRRSDASRRP